MDDLKTLDNLRDVKNLFQHKLDLYNFLKNEMLFLYKIIISTLNNVQTNFMIKKIGSEEYNKNLSNIERLFVGLAWIPKATVQAALGSVPLDLVKTSMGESHPDYEEYKAFGEQILVTAVVAILLTAPLGLICINTFGDKWLNNDIDNPIEEDEHHSDDDDELGDIELITAEHESDDDKENGQVNVTRSESSSAADSGVIKNLRQKSFVGAVADIFVKIVGDESSSSAVMNSKLKKREKTVKPEKVKDKGSQAITDAKGLYFINAEGIDKNKPTQIWTQGETEANSAWFPTIDAPNQKTSQEIYITVPNQYKTLSNGTLISQTNTGENRTDYWKFDQKHAPYLSFMAVGEFEIIQDSYKNIPVNYYVEKEYAPYAKDIFGLTP